MKAEFQEGLKAAGLGSDPLELRVPVEVNDRREILPLTGPTVPVTDGDNLGLLALPPISQLLTGREVPPDFSQPPVGKYLAAFVCIETTCAQYSAAAPRPVQDTEFERLFSLLRRRPEGFDPNPLFGYLQATVRLMASVSEFSPAELEAILRRLGKSARRWQSHPGSTNYFDRVLRDFL